MLFGHNNWDAVTTDGFETNAPISSDIEAPTNVSGMPIYVITELDTPINGRKYLIDFANAGLGAKSRAELSVASAKASATNPPSAFGVPSGYWLDETQPYSGPEETDEGTTTGDEIDDSDDSDDGSEVISPVPESNSGSATKYAAIGGIALIGVLAITKMGKRKV